jgi:hypothetical protein
VVEGRDQRSGARAGGQDARLVLADGGRGELLAVLGLFLGDLGAEPGLGTAGPGGVPLAVVDQPDRQRMAQLCLARWVALHTTVAVSDCHITRSFVSVMSSHRDTTHRTA